MLRLLLVACCLGLWAGLLLPAAAQTAPPIWQWANGHRAHPLAGPGSLATDSQGNVYISGYYVDSIRLDSRTVFTRGGGYVAKYSATGGLVWAQQLYGMTGGRVMPDGTGGVYLGGMLTGNTNSPQLGTLTTTVAKLVFCGYLAKLNAQGQPEWLRPVGAGLTGNCTVSDAGRDAAGNFYVTGSLSGTVDFGTFTLTTGGPANTAPNDAFLVKLNPQGVPLWGRQGGRTLLNNLPSFSLTVSDGGDAYLTGATSTDTGPFGGLPMPAAGGYTDVLLVKYNAQGTPQWLRRYPAGSSQEVALAHSAVLDGLGRLVVPLEYNGHLNLGSQTLDAGTAARNGALATFDTATGNLVWVTTMQSPGFSFGNAAVNDAANNIYFLGDFSYSTVIGGQTLTYANGRAGVVACFSPQGILRWVKQADGVLPYLVALGSGGHLSVAGTYSGAPAFDGITLPQYSYTLSQSNGGFVAQFGALPLAVRSALSTQPLALYPNPARTSVYLPALPTGTQVRVLDALGRTVQHAKPAATLALDGLAPGLYYVQATAPAGQQWRSQLVVE